MQTHDILGLKSIRTTLGHIGEQRGKTDKTANKQDASLPRRQFSVNSLVQRSGFAFTFLVHLRLYAENIITLRRRQAGKVRPVPMYWQRRINISGSLEEEDEGKDRGGWGGWVGGTGANCSCSGCTEFKSMADFVKIVANKRTLKLEEKRTEGRKEGRRLWRIGLRCIDWPRPLGGGLFAYGSKGRNSVAGRAVVSIPLGHAHAEIGFGIG